MASSVISLKMAIQHNLPINPFNLCFNDIGQNNMLMDKKDTVPITLHLLKLHKINISWNFLEHIPRCPPDTLLETYFHNTFDLTK